MATQGRAGCVRDLFALAQVQLLDVRAGLSQRPHRLVANALTSSQRQLTQEATASTGYIFYYWSLKFNFIFNQDIGRVGQSLLFSFEARFVKFFLFMFSNSDVTYLYVSLKIEEVDPLPV